MDSTAAWGIREREGEGKPFYIYLSWRLWVSNQLKRRKKDVYDYYIKPGPRGRKTDEDGVIYRRLPNSKAFVMFIQ